MFFVIGLVLSPLYLIWTTRAPSWTRTGVKALPVGCFTLAAWLAEAPPFLTVALFLSLLGDLALSRDGRQAFLFGMASFGLAHVVFVMLFQSIGGGALWEGFAEAPVVAILVLIAALSSEIWLAPFTGVMRWPVRAYVAVITAMVLVVWTLPFGLIQIGALLFMASDTVLSLVLFRLTPATAWHDRAAWALWVLYVAGQALIYLGAMRLAAG